MWAYLAEGGLYESRDAGLRWVQVFDGNVLDLVAVGWDAGDALLGVDPFAGLVRSDDDGRRWRSLGRTPVAPVTSLAAILGGQVLLVGGPDGLFRAGDSGAAFQRAAVLAVATTLDGHTVAAVTDTGLL